MNKIKKWNWTAFLVVLCTAEIGALTNKNMNNVSTALLFGLIAGILFGLLIAIITKED